MEAEPARQGVGGVRGPGAVSAGKETRPRARARARSLEDARALRAAAAGSREGACPLEGLLGSRVRVYARLGARGGEGGLFALHGAGSTCLRTDGGSLCSEETQASEGGCETERPVSVLLALFICLLPICLLPLTPPNPKR